jgi:hypothetical protein
MSRHQQGRVRCAVDTRGCAEFRGVQNARGLARVAVAALFTCLAGCATQSFQPQFKPPAVSKQVVVNGLMKSHPRPERPVAVGLTTDPMRLVAWDLARGALLWEKPVNAKSAPLVAADAVVCQEEAGVVVRDLASGEIRTVVDERGALVGADGQGSTLVISLAYDQKALPGAVALVEGTHVRWKQILNLPVGVPALSGEYVVVPWATQRLTVLAAADGAELARFHYKSSVMGHARVEGGQLYVGQLGLIPVTKTLLDEPGRKHAPYTPHKRELPGQPPLLRDGYAPVADPDNAYHRLQVSWRVRQHEGAPGTENDLFLLRFYRLLYALDANADQIRWVRTFDQDLVGTAIQSGVIMAVDARGTLRYYDPDGALRFSQPLGRDLRVIALRPGSWLHPAMAAGGEQVASAQPSTATGAVRSGDAPLGTLREQLYAAATLEDDRLGVGRAYAATHLSRFPEAEVTAQLIGICSERHGPEPVRTAACAQLRERTTGDAVVLSALRVRASFLEGTEAPPVGALAQAAAKMQLKQAGPLLVSQIEDPNTPARDLAAAFESIAGLGERSAAATIERFVRLHHAEPEGSELLPALGAALRTLGSLRATAQRGTLVDIAADPLTPKATREQAQAALNALDAPVAQPRAETAEASTQEEVQTDPRPYALTPDVVRKTLAPLRERLSHCLATDSSHPHTGRTSVVIDAMGRVEGVFVSPSTLQPCVEPLLREAKFPSTRLGRQRITHIFGEPEKAAAPKH